MIIKKNVLPVFAALCMSVVMILAGCANPVGGTSASVDQTKQEEQKAVVGHPDAKAAPEVVSHTANQGEEDLLVAFLSNVASTAEEHNVSIADHVAFSNVEITGQIWFTTTSDTPVTVTVDSLTIADGSTLQVDPKVTLIVTNPINNGNPSINRSINYARYSDAGNNGGQGAIAVNTNGKVVVKEDIKLLWLTTNTVEVYSGGTLEFDDKDEHELMTITPTEYVKFNEGNSPILFAPPQSGKYDLYKVKKYREDGLILMAYTIDYSRSGGVNINEWAPVNFDYEGYVYFKNGNFSKFSDTLKKIANNPQQDKFTLVVGSDTSGAPNKGWYENNVTYVILSGDLGQNGKVTVDVTQFPVVLPQGKLSGGSGAEIYVASGAYLDVAAKKNAQYDQDGEGAFQGGLFVKSGGAVRDSAWMGWPLGVGSAFNVDHGGRIAVGEGTRDGATAWALGGDKEAAFNGWLAGMKTDGTPEIPVKAVWGEKNPEYVGGGYVAINAKDVVLAGDLRLEKSTGIIYNVNIAPASTLTIAANQILVLNTELNIYAALRAPTGPGLTGTAKGPTVAREGGKLVLETGANILKGSAPLWTDGLLTFVGKSDGGTKNTNLDYGNSSEFSFKELVQQ